MSETRNSSVFLLCDATQFEDFVALAEGERWTLVNQHDGDGKVMGFSQVWIARDGVSEIHYVHEPALGIRFLVVRGPSLDSGALDDPLFQNLQLRTSINVLRIARKAQTDEAKRVSAFELAVVFLESDPRALELLRSYYDAGSEPVRRRVISALTYRGWAEGVEMLEEIATIDESEELRGHARDMVEMWRARTVTGHKPR